MAAKRMTYIKTLFLGLGLIVLSVLLHFILPGITIPALPNINIPLNPFLACAGVVLTILSLIVFFSEKDG